ncbi:MAG: DNA polymerase III subunit delta [Clostridia bacterium]|nr:DNA polymerase III subunit delta [Clostridia bacterium]
MAVSQTAIKAINFNVKNKGGNAFLLTGDDLYWRDYVVNSILSLVPEAEREFNYRSFSDIKSIEETESAFTSTGFFGGINVVSISGYGAKKSTKGETKIADKEKKLFESLVTGLDENTILILSNSNIPLSLSRYFIEIDCSKLDFSLLRDYVPKLIAPKKIDGNALYTLVEYCNRDMLKISNELKKLIAYMGNRQVISHDMVELLVANTVENEIYELANALADKNKTKAMGLFDKFVAKGIDYSVILSTLVGQYRRLLHCALSNRSDKELAEDLKIKEWAVKRTRETASRYGKATLKACLDDLIDAEYNFKSGLMVDETAVRTVMAKLVAK